jgi:hypothetical protein
MKRVVPVLSVILLLILLGTGTVLSMNIAIAQVDASVQDIILRDDAFHGRGKFPFIEWWYFDAKFDNGYTVTVGIQILNILAKGIVNTRLTIYNQGVVVLKNYEKHSFRDLFASTENPSVNVAGKQLIVGTYDALSDCFVYNVTVNTSDGTVSLHFVGCTKGWKRQQQTGDWWAVVLPRANVTGTISIGDMTMNVTGTGYHDHNWGIGPRIVLRFGWLWGTCSSSNYSVTWAEVSTTRYTHYPIMVVNKKDGGYLGIPSQTIWFSGKNINIDHYRFVPHFFNIETMTDKVFLVINMEVISVDHTKFLGFIDYWRYHVKCTGTIIADRHMETVDEISIMEYLRFR